MEKIWLVPILASILIVGIFSLQYVEGHGTVDQFFDVCAIDCNEFIRLNLSQTGQEFTPPSQCFLGSIDLSLNSDTTQTDTITVNIRSGSITGPILGTTSKTITAIGFDFAEHFDFSTPISLIGGNIYVIEPTTPTFTFEWINANSGGYPGGTAIRFGVPYLVPDADFGFATYCVPPPLTEDQIKEQQVAVDKAIEAIATYQGKIDKAQEEACEKIRKEILILPDKGIDIIPIEILELELIACEPIILQ